MLPSFGLLKTFDVVKDHLYKLLETDASVQGLGCVLSQKQDDGKLHPAAYASRALSPRDRNYAITELDTPAVVWAVTYF